MEDGLAALTEKLEQFQFEDDHIGRALANLSQSSKKKLLLGKPDGISQGRFYESLVFEALVDLSADKFFSGIVKKQTKKRGRRKRGDTKQVRVLNGFCYDNSEAGNVIIRGAGQDLAEFDFVLLDNDSRICFGEISISQKSRKDIDLFIKQIQYKRSLINELISQSQIPLILITVSDVAKLYCRVGKLPDTYTAAIDFDYDRLKNFTIPKQNRSGPRIQNLITIETIFQSHPPFDYQKRHNDLKKALISASRSKKSITEIKSQIESVIVDKLIIGSVYRGPGLRACLAQGVFLKEMPLDENTCCTCFSNTILAMNIPELRATLYMKVRRNFLKKDKSKLCYLKFGLQTSGEFKFERNIPTFGGMFTRLDRARGKVDTKDIVALIRMSQDAAFPKPKRKCTKGPNIRLDLIENLSNPL
eukprot:TRINITY_DN6978_c0_g1_i1.p1 TRINITY_DN6978_c0_g1~~TRINITY_DN6978_c0_g1_i1.p1  ORF type:complete len:417 (+),score=57.90 TRINITY_DN6978_c0_g1_i1:142-1392(+)